MLIRCIKRCLPLALMINHAMAADCLYINSYQAGDAWGDRIQQQFEHDIHTTCQTSYYYLNANNDSPEQLKNTGIEITNIIALKQPDVVIAADDAASNYVIKPFLRNGRTPVVYVGINWDPKPYGYPMDNATGMTETWPIEEVLTIARHTVKTLQQLSIITSTNALEQTDALRMKKIAEQNAIEVRTFFVHNFEDWKKAILAAQSSDAIHIDINASIRGWNATEAIQWLKTHNQRFTFTSQDVMRPYVMFSLSKSPEEFGHWAAMLTNAILKGTQPWQIPIIPNHQFIPYYNEDLLALTHYQLPASVKRHSLAFKMPANP